MEKRRIGSLEVSVVGLGCNNFGRRLDFDRSAKVVGAALEAGVNFFDTADVYGDGKSEEFLARALGNRRTSVHIASKFGMSLNAQRSGGARPDYVRQALDDSLRRLRTDYVDLYQLHRPDPNVPIADTLGALNDLVRAGKVREIGCSNFSADQILDAEATLQGGARRFVSVQNEYSLLQRQAERGVLPECRERHLAFLPYFPLASGLLTGKYRKDSPLPEGARLSTETARLSGRFLTSDNYATVERLRTFAESRGYTLVELAISWLLVRPAVASVIAGATSESQVNANVNAFKWRFSAEELAHIDEIAPSVSTTPQS